MCGSSDAEEERADHIQECPTGNSTPNPCFGPHWRALPPCWESFSHTPRLLSLGPAFLCVISLLCCLGLPEEGWNMWMGQSLVSVTL